MPPGDSGETPRKRDCDWQDLGGLFHAWRHMKPRLSGHGGVQILAMPTGIAVVCALP